MSVMNWGINICRSAILTKYYNAKLYVLYVGGRISDEMWYAGKRAEIARRRFAALLHRIVKK